MQWRVRPMVCPAVSPINVLCCCLLFFPTNGVVPRSFLVFPGPDLRPSSGVRDGHCRRHLGLARCSVHHADGGRVHAAELNGVEGSVRVEVGGGEGDGLAGRQG